MVFYYFFLRVATNLTGFGRWEGWTSPCLIAQAMSMISGEILEILVQIYVPSLAI